MHGEKSQQLQCQQPKEPTPKQHNKAKSPELFWVWPFLPHQLSNRFRFKVSLTDPFISWKASMLFSWKLSKVLVPSVTSPIHQVLYLSPQLPESCENLVPKPHTHRQSKQPSDGRESLKPGLRELGMGIQPLSHSFPPPPPSILIILWMPRSFNTSGYQYRSTKTTSVMRCSGQRAQELQKTHTHTHLSPLPLL